MKRLFFIVLYLVCHEGLQGADTLSVSRRSQLWHSDKDLFVWLSENQPALKFYYPIQKYSDIETFSDYQNNQSLHYHYQGDKHLGYGGRAYGYYRHQKNALFGSAAYLSGKKENITWSHVDDAARLGPYILADSTTGNKNYETYLLSGGLSRQTMLGVVGLSVQYRAQSSYRTKDPRSYTVVSDFNISAGWASAINPIYLLAFSSTYGRYDQDVSIRSYQEGRTDLFYFMYGFGFFNQNISGTASTFSVDYRGNSFEMNAHFVPVSAQGWFLQAKYRTERMDALYSQRTRGRYHPVDILFEGGYQWRQNRHQFRLDYQVRHSEGKGTEYYYETIIVDSLTASTETRLLAKNQKYLQKKSEMLIKGKGWIPTTEWTFIPELIVGFLSSSSAYRTTLWETQIQQWNFNPSLEIEKKRDNSLSSIKTSLLWIKTINEKLNIPEDDTIVKNTLLPDFQYQSADKFLAGMELLHIHRMENKNAWKVAASCNVLNSGGDLASSVLLSLGLILN